MMGNNYPEIVDGFHLCLIAKLRPLWIDSIEVESYQYLTLRPLREPVGTEIQATAPLKIGTSLGINPIIGIVVFHPSKLDQGH